ncbi:hypothetical protein N7457_002053 [Penicillium paradoxum]|uniref:uncharacterized protein n=1 Tax=Penicillium paradoxum TaxID=176176 RepID=UPI002549032B|nr:uncharacterized protein N7457_002053 [Penicillium paradoxum]KAJ5787063.1 hypothetical protein N7457_002053 [Penicillium paradoxum]
MRYALLAGSILATTALAAPVSNQNNLIRYASTAANIGSTETVGVAKRGGGDGHDSGSDADDSGSDGLLDLGILGILKRDGSETSAITKRSNDLNIGDLTVDNLDVPPNLDIKNIPRDVDNAERRSKGLFGLKFFSPLKRDDALLTDGDENGNGGGVGDLLGTLGLRKRDGDSSIGGIGGIDIGTPIIDAVNI